MVLSLIFLREKQYHILFKSFVINRGMGTSIRSQRENDAEGRIQFIWHSEEARIRVLEKENSPEEAKQRNLDDELGQINAP